MMFPRDRIIGGPVMMCCNGEYWVFQQNQHHWRKVKKLFNRLAKSK